MEKIRTCREKKTNDKSAFERRQERGDVKI